MVTQAIGPCGISHVAVVTADRDRFRTFYEDVIGHTLSNPTNMIFDGERALVANLGRWHITSIDMSAILG